MHPEWPGDRNRRRRRAGLGTDVVVPAGHRWMDNRDMAMQWKEYFDHAGHQLRAMKPHEQILSIQGHGESICQRVNYLTDPQFAGMFDANPMHSGKGRRGTGKSDPPQSGPSSRSL